MKKLLIVPILLISLVGCVSQTVKDAVNRDAARTDRYLELMAEGKTTPAMDHDFIKANRVAFHTLDYNLNGNPLPPDIAAVVSE